MATGQLVTMSGRKLLLNGRPRPTSGQKSKLSGQQTIMSGQPTKKPRFLQSSILIGTKLIHSPRKGNFNLKRIVSRVFLKMIVSNMLRIV